MTKKKISLYRELQREDGFTLVELLAVLVIIGILAAVAVPAMEGYIQDTKKKAYISEAYVVRAAVQSYLIDQSMNRTLSDMNVYLDLIAPKIEDRENAVNSILAGSCTKGAKIAGVGYHSITKKVTNLVYRVGTYEIEIKGDSDVEVRTGK